MKVTINDKYFFSGTDYTADTSHKLLSTCQKGLDKLLSRLMGHDLEQLQNDMDDIAFKPEGLDIGEDYK